MMSPKRRMFRPLLTSLMVLTLLFVFSSLALADNTPVNGTASYANLITDKEIEIKFDTPVTAENAKATFKVTVDGQEVDYIFLSYFDFDGRVNLRLDKALNTGTLPRRQGTSSGVTSFAGDMATKGPIAAGKVEVTVVATGQKLTTAWVPFYNLVHTGSKSKIVAIGNDTMPNVGSYNGQYVIDYCAEGVNKMVGRSEYLTLNASEADLSFRVVASNQSVYEAPEYRELYNPADYKTRTSIPGTVDKPIVVTTADNVMRQASTGTMERPKSDRFYVIEDFARLFWQFGVIDGCKRIPLGIYDTEDDYDFVAHFQKAYDEAKSKNLWPGTKMMESLENYYAYGTLVWFEMLPESPDGSWQPESFPVNTRAELIEYDKALYGPMVEVYGEFEYFSGLLSQTMGNDTAVRSNFPWYKHSQVDNYGIDGKLYGPLEVVECNLISNNMIELIFNHDVRDITNLRNASNWKITWTNSNNVTRTYTGSGSSNISTIPPYQWKTLTLQVSSATFTDASIGTAIRGFTQEDIDARKVSAGGWISNSEQPSATALRPGEFMDLEKLVSERGAGINGSITVEFLGSSNVCDWADNKLAQDSYDVTFKPYQGQVYRTPKTGVYVYADNDVQKSSLELAGIYIDQIFSNPFSYTSGATTYNNIGQRLADGMVKANAGLQIVAYGHHAMQQPGSRNNYSSNYPYYLYVEGWGGGVAQTTEFNLLRDYTFTRYRNEFILGHEFAHSIEGAMTQYTGLGTERTSLYSKVVTNGLKWKDSNGTNSYAGSNASEYWASLTNIWHGTMRESTDGTNNGTWTPCNTREELFRYDKDGFDFMKKVYFNGDLGLWYEGKVGDPAYKVEVEDWALLAQDEDLLARGITFDNEDDIIKWGCSFPATMANDPYTGHTDQRVRWVSWSTPNLFNIALKTEYNGNFKWDFAGYDWYYPGSATKSFNNPFLEYPYVTKPAKPVAGEMSDLRLFGSDELVFSFNAEVDEATAPLSFTVKVDDADATFTFVSYENGRVALKLAEALADPATAKVEVTVVATEQTLTAAYSGTSLSITYGFYNKEGTQLQEPVTINYLSAGDVVDFSAYKSFDGNKLENVGFESELGLSKVDLAAYTGIMPAGNVVMKLVYGDVPVTNLQLTTDANNVKAGDEFILTTSFKVPVNSNAAILDFVFDKNKFEYVSFTPAAGVMVLTEEDTDTGEKITVMVQDYDTSAYGDLKLAAKATADLNDEENEIHVTVNYVVLLANGTKKVEAETASTKFDTIIVKPWDGKTFDLINLSNMIDVFGMTSADPKWKACKVYDIVENGEIDIADISLFASMIGK